MSNEVRTATASHTPGPWRYSAGHIVAGRGLIIASIGVQAQHTMPNAALIASAPELLAALQAMIAYDSARDDLERFADIIKQADTAISKATGEA